MIDYTQFMGKSWTARAVQHLVVNSNSLSNDEFSGDNLVSMQYMYRIAKHPHGVF